MSSRPLPVCQSITITAQTCASHNASRGEINAGKVTTIFYGLVSKLLWQH